MQRGGGGSNGGASRAGKLTADALNTLSVAVAAAGFIEPIVEAVDADLTRYTRLGAALVIHLAARWSLGALEE